MSMLTRALVVALAAGMSGPAWGLSAVTGPNGFVANDSTNFAAVSPANELVNSPFVYTTPGGLQLTLTSSNGGTLTLDKTPTFSRDFLPGQTQVFATTGDSITITFAQGIRGVATQVTHPHQGAYVAAITVFDTGSNSLGTFTQAGFENNSGDGSAVWLGAQDANPIIGSVRFDLSEGTAFSLTNLDTVLIGDLQLLTGSGGPPTGQPVPEPAVAGMLLAGVLGLGWRFRRGRVSGG